jgi:hypothetical protein
MAASGEPALCVGLDDKVEAGGGELPQRDLGLRGFAMTRLSSSGWCGERCSRPDLKFRLWPEPVRPHAERTVFCTPASRQSSRTC